MPAIAIRPPSRPPSQANHIFSPRTLPPIPLTTPFFSSRPSTPLAPPSKPNAPPPYSPFCVTNYNRGFLRPMQPATQCATQLYRTKQRNSESRSTVQGLTIALTTKKQRPKLLPIYGKRGLRIFNPHPAHRSSLENHEKINRHTEKIEHLVSHSKQRIATQINRHTSQGPSFSFSLFTFPFSFCHLAPQSSFNSHSISNRKPEILEPYLSPAFSTNHPVLIANFEPSEPSLFRRTFLPHTLNPTPCFSDHQLPKGPSFPFSLFTFLFSNRTTSTFAFSKKYQILFLYTLRSIWPQIPSFRLS